MDGGLAESTATLSISQPSHTIGEINVLVIEDDEQQRELLGLLFCQANEKNGATVRFVVTFASLAAEALAIIERQDFHLILLDLVLPDKPGHDLLSELRVHVDPEVAIVIATAHSQTALVQLCVSRGADAFLVKPLGSAEVQHIWQFVKYLPESSFTAKLPETSSFRTRSEAASEPLPPRSASVCGDPATRAVSNVVIPDAPTRPTYSVLARAGAFGPTPSGTALDAGAVRVGVSRRVTPIEDIGTSASGVRRTVTPTDSENSGSGVSRRTTPIEDGPVMADCKQQ
jgi:CheY-like chemotaxis protein